MRHYLLAFIMALSSCAALLALSSCSGASGNVQDPVLARQKAENDADAAAIRRLLELNGSSALAPQVLNRFAHDAKEVYPTVPQQFIENFVRQVKQDDFYSMMVPIYARRFSREEIQQLIAFYDSPIGQKLVTQIPAINAETSDATQQWNQRLSQIFVQQLRAKRYLSN